VVSGQLVHIPVRKVTRLLPPSLTHWVTTFTFVIEARKYKTANLCDMSPLKRAHTIVITVSHNRYTTDTPSLDTVFKGIK
jgi:hypothetical protein